MTQEIEILQFLHYNPEASRAEIGSALTNPPSPATLKRMIADSVSKGYIEVVGRGPATRYKLTPQAHVTMELNLNTYFDKDVDERQVQESFNFELINETLPRVDLFIANGYCPISFRTVDSIDYKKAMLMFYEQNNIAAFKHIFIDQFLFAVKTYF